MTKTKERPIVFPDVMVRAVLDDRKTQTRRIVKRPRQVPVGYIFRPEVLSDTSLGWWAEATGLNVGFSQECPHGKPCDRLWVKESWFNRSGDDKNPDYIYRSDGVVLESPMVWGNPLFMPRSASRIILEITNIRVERVQDISEGEAREEGWDMSNLPLGHAYDGSHHAIEWFQSYWDSKVNQSRYYPWDSNPWVWVIEFKRVT